MPRGKVITFPCGFFENGLSVRERDILKRLKKRNKAFWVLFLTCVKRYNKKGAENVWTCKTTKTETVVKLNHRDSNGDGKCDMCGFKVGGSENPDTPDDPSNNCNYICHKTGFTHFFI